MAASSPVPALEIHIDATSRCRIISGPERRVYYSTPQLAGLALLQNYRDEETVEDAAASRSITWSDTLISHGLAHGVRGASRYLLAVIPATERTITYQGRETAEQRLTATFPPLLVALAFGASNFRRGLVFLVNPAALSRLTVSLADAVATSFPYGNVYNSTGRICWGTVRHNHITDLAGFLDLFFNSAFNSDLYHGSGGSLAGAVRAAPGGVLPSPAAGAYTLSIPSVISQLVSV